MIPNDFDPNSTALLVVDIQNDFCHQNGFFARSGKNVEQMQSILPKLRYLIDGAREAGVRVIFVKSYFDEKYISHSMKLRKTYLGRTEDVCQEGSWGSEFVILPETGDLVIVKHAFSAFIGTLLEETLRRESIESLAITGVLTNVCCESTLRDGLMLGFNTVLIEDCCASDSIDAHHVTIYNVTNYFGWVTNSNTLLDFWAKQSRD
jgi:ureidoacrylate peracid hydrolase